ncbi:hypothetical protein RJ639_032254 [Escallonia herrerae]|uniref:Kinesin-like protein n=1 Tax=Escallonia herrerae TaxID=1293975 RepID=A0AA88WUF5_9ASTE|nr:hypothetical protein RJ639_032254 [Escallonia herrerae]
MSTVGRQMQRSGSTGHHKVHHHHHRQYSDNFIDTAFSNKWLQSAGLHQLHSSNPSVPALQDFGFYGNNNGGTQGSVLSRSLQRSVNGGGNEDPWTPPSYSGLSSLMKNDIAELSPGLLDLHSFDTELIPEVSVSNALPHVLIYTSLLKTEKESLNPQDTPSGVDELSSVGFSPVTSLNSTQPCMDITVSNNLGKAYVIHIVDLTLGFWYVKIHSQYTDDLEHCIVINNLTKGSRLQENNLLKGFSADRERGNNVAKIKVVVRKRPLNKKEIAKKEEDIVTIDPTTNSLTVHETKLKVDLTEYVEKNEFVFDAVMGEDVSNNKVYSETVEPIVPIIFQRTKATWSGKTYTMQPLPLKASQDIFRLIHHNYRNEGYQLFVSFFEIYGGKVFDLLNERKKLCMREDGKQQVCIVGLQEHRVSHVETVKELIEKGNATRSTGTTGANEESSRSHAILQLAIKRLVDGNESKPARPIGKLSFIDLAGSERGADTTDNDKQTRMEGAEINKSLLALKECIRALDNDQGHIPFRGSKLTEVLRDSFVGDSRTVMISCISPNLGSCEHTLNTLRYADRVKSLSKGNSSRKDPLTSSVNLRSSTALPSSSLLPTILGSKDEIIHESNRFGWSKETERDSSRSFNMDRFPSRAQDLVSTVSPSNKYQGGCQGDIIEDDFELSEETYGQDKPFWMMNKKVETYEHSALEAKATEPSSQTKQTDTETDNSGSRDNLNVLLQEEEHLIIAHRRQVEDTMITVREEMNLLAQVEQPGNQLDDYLSRLNDILSQKAARISELKTRLGHFQRHLKEYKVLASSRH